MNFSIQAVNPKSTGSDTKIRCHLCDKEHKLENCEEFRKKSGDEQFKFVRSKKLCDNCLSSYHFSAGCRRWKACKIPDCNMKRKHLTFLHEAIVAYEKKRSEQSGSSSRQQQPRSNTRQEERKPFVGMMSHTGAECSLSVVPVRVKGNYGKKEVTTYALLDNGSTASFSFYTKDLLRELGVATTKCHLSLATVSNVAENCEGTMASLRITNLEENVFVEIPQAFAMKTLNISRDAIAKQEDVERWPHLQDIKLPRELKDAKISLLIGVNIPEALEPEEVRRGKNGGPYAVKTKFGWTLNGPLTRSRENGKQCFLSNAAYSDDPLSEQLRQYFNHDFDDSADDKKMIIVLIS
eukprot:Seg1622.10 transcript_id=Seg1622.10/GoldUCD/mRNA.D3Y31 product="hypothetical protein" pseudo=true protein_id=Seg1622.10/GoldUCD/D3Y31